MRTLWNTTAAIAIIVVIAPIAKAQQGIGVDVANPLEKLDVNGAIRIGTDFTNSNAAPSGGAGTIRWNGTNFQGWDGTQWITFGSSGSDNDWVISGNTIYNANSGNVGIGTPTPTDELYVANPTNTASTVSIESGNQLYPAALRILPSTHANSRRTALRLDDWFILQDRTGTGIKDFAIYQNSATAQRLNIDVNGNVGIGDQTPDVKLDVEGSIQMVDGNQQAGYIPVSDVNGTMTWTDPTTITTASDGDGSATNELQTISQSGLDVTLSNGGGTISVADNDNSTTNELQSLSQSGLDITLSNGGGTFSVADNDNSATNELQTLSISGSDITLSNSGGTVTIPVATKLADGDGDTKIQVEETADEDIIRFDIKGTEHFRMVNGTLEILNNGGSIFIGEDAGLNDNLTNNENVFIGLNAGKENVTGDDNTSVGNFSLEKNSSGRNNVALGHSALEVNVSGSYNTAVGTGALSLNVSGDDNVAVGSRALIHSTSNGNTAIGKSALFYQTTGRFNTVIGHVAGEHNITGSDNVVIGKNAMSSKQTGSQNTIIGKDAGRNSGVSGNGNVFLGFQAGHNAGGDNRLYIENSSSNSPLVYGEFDNDLLRVNGTLNINSAFSFPTVDGTNGYIMTTNGSGTVSWTDPTTISTAADDDWTVSGNDLFNANTGNVGVGTSTPSEKLHVVDGTVHLDRNSDGSNTLNKFTISGAFPGPGSPYASIDMHNLDANNGAVDYSGASIRSYNNGGSNDGDLRFYVSSNQTLSEAMMIDHLGSVGIGTTTPNEALEVTGSIRMNDGNQSAGYIPVSDANGTMTWTDPTTITAGDDGDWTVSGNNAYSSVSGNIGIGTSAPSSRLYVANSSNATPTSTIESGSATYPTALRILGSSHATSDRAAIGLDDWLIYQDRVGDGVKDFGIYQTSAAAHRFNIMTNGNIGIGTETPDQKLSVIGQIRAANDVAETEYVEISHGGAHGYINTVGDGNLDFRHDGSTLMSLMDNGNLGIGTSSPSQKLDVTGSANVSSDLFVGMDAEIGDELYVANKASIGVSSTSYGLEVVNAASASFVAFIRNAATSATNSTQYNGLRIKAGKDANNSADSRMIVFHRPDNTTIGAVIQDNASTVDYYSASDIRLKTNIAPTHYSLEDLMQIEVKDYAYKSDPEGIMVTGFLAQQLYEAYPEAVSEGGANETEDPWMVAYGKLTPLLVKAVQDLKAEKDALQAQVEALLLRVQLLEQQ